MEYIYTITSLATSKVYVGRTCTIATRRASHFANLVRGVHINKQLQQEFNTYGIDNLVFEVVDSCDDGNVVDLEEYWISLYSKDSLLNVVLRGTGGRRLTDEQLKDRAVKCFDALDYGYENSIGLNALARIYKIASGTLIKYRSEWENARGCLYEHPQTKDTKARVEAFISDFEADPDSALANRDNYGISHKSFSKYLPEYGYTLEDVYKTKWRDESIDNARKAYEYKMETRCTVMEALEKCGASVTTFYKYVDEWRANDSRPFNSEEVDKCVLLEMQDGMSMNKACKKWRISSGTVKKFCPEWVQYKKQNRKEQ